MEYILSWIILSIIIGFVGDGRKIGFFKAFVASLILSPVVGVILTFASKSKSQIAFEDNLIKQTVMQTEQLAKVNRGSLTEELLKLKTLLDAGLITMEEFNSQKKKLQNDTEPNKTTLALYSSQTRGFSGELQARIGKNTTFVDLPRNKEDSFKLEVNPGQIEVLIKPKGVGFKKTVFLEVKEGTTAYYDIFKIY
ncbi:MAG TPA: hypothetical protein DCG77_15040 [Sphingobacterium sp.]|nr:hypothetical protein [Sphingobacterium sp.]